MNLKKIALLSGLVVGSLAFTDYFNSANALVFNVPNYGKYDVTIIGTEGTTNPLNSASKLKANPFYSVTNDSSVARAFASAVADSFGYPNAGYSQGPWFLYDISNGSANYLYETPMGNLEAGSYPDYGNATFALAQPAKSFNTVPFEFSPEQGFMLGIPLFIGLRQLKKKRK